MREMKEEKRKRETGFIAYFIRREIDKWRTGAFPAKKSGAVPRGPPLPFIRSFTFLPFALQLCFSAAIALLTFIRAQLAASLGTPSSGARRTRL